MVSDLLEDISSIALSSASIRASLALARSSSNCALAAARVDPELFECLLMLKCCGLISAGETAGASVVVDDGCDLSTTGLLASFLVFVDFSLPETDTARFTADTREGIFAVIGNLIASTKALLAVLVLVSPIASVILLGTHVGKVKVV